MKTLNPPFRGSDTPASLKACPMSILRTSGRQQQIWRRSPSWATGPFLRDERVFRGQGKEILQYTSKCFFPIGFLLARQLLAAPLPQDTIRHIQTNRRGVRMAGEIHCCLISGVRHTATERESLYFLFRALFSWRYRLRFLWGVATEPCRDNY